MKIITLQMLKSQMKDDAKTNIGCGIVFLVLAVMCIIGGFTVHPILSLFMMAVFGFGAWKMLGSGRHARKSVNQNSFYILTVNCQKKHTESRGEDGDAYILTFENGCIHTITPNDVTLNTETPDCNDEWLYNNTEIGDSFYLVFTKEGEGPDYILHKKLCQLDTAGFKEENGRLHPCG